MATKTTTVAELEKQIRALEGVEYHVETNQGTYGASEAARAVGSGDPAVANRDVYETVGGRRRHTGPTEAAAPGRMRHINRAALAADRKRLDDLRRRLKAARQG